MPIHKVTMDDYPGGGTLCLCVRGVDHTEAEFDIPLESDDEA